MWNAWLDESQARIKIARRSVSNLRYADDTTLMAEREELLKSFFNRVKEKSEKAGLKLTIQKLMALVSITSWQIEGEKLEEGTDFFSWPPKSLQTVTAAMKLEDACSLVAKLWQS